MVCAYDLDMMAAQPSATVAPNYTVIEAQEASLSLVQICNQLGMNEQDGAWFEWRRVPTSPNKRACPLENKNEIKGDAILLR